MQNAWNILAGTSGMVYLGFDRSQALSVMQMHGIKPKKQRAMLDALTEMETAALPILNKR